MYIGLDLGTSGLKGILIGEDQTVLAEATAPLTVSARMRAGASRPRRLDRGGRTVLDRCPPRALAQVRGIGLSGHMHGATLLDAARRGAAPLHPVERHPQP
jgi:xylulokinase